MSLYVEVQQDATILSCLQDMEPITLEQMSSIRLMNRTDMKFVTNKSMLVQLLNAVGTLYYVQDIDGKRISNYRTVYFDTPDHHFYMIHHNGKSPRQKVRIRTYLDSDISFLEIKDKNNHGRTQKERVKIKNLDSFACNECDDFIRGALNIGFDDLSPVIENQFQRVTLVNYGKTERLTIDFNVAFKNFETQKSAETGDLVIIELKRSGHEASPILSELRTLRIKPFGFSKYCIGSTLTNSNLKDNRSRIRMRTLHKKATLPLN